MARPGFWAASHGSLCAALVRSIKEGVRGYLVTQLPRCFVRQSNLGKICITFSPVFQAQMLMSVY